MDISIYINRAKRILNKELRKKRQWQSYVAAFGIVFVFFMVSRTLMAAPETVPVTKTESEVIKRPELPKENEEADTWMGDQASGQENLPTAAEVVNESSVAPKSEPSEVNTEEESKSEPAEVATESEEVDELASASSVVSEFYDSLDEGDTSEAYDKLSPSFREMLSYRRFKRGYRHVEGLSCEVKRTELLDDDRVRLDVELSVSEDGYESQYLATCLVTKVNDEWLVSGIVQLEG